MQETIRRWLPVILYEDMADEFNVTQQVRLLLFFYY